MKTVRRSGGNNTRNLILDKANELITEVGMSEFKVDVLAGSLGLSPGNITYHFHRKEDIASALWERALQNIEQVCVRHVTPILDVKQLFLFLRCLVGETYFYRGVIAYKLGDVSLIASLVRNGRSPVVFFDKEYGKVIRYLADNGYLDEERLRPFAEPTRRNIFTLLAWWVQGNGGEGNLLRADEAADRFAVSVLCPLLPFLTEVGKEQYDDLVEHTIKNSRDEKRQGDE